MSPHKLPVCSGVEAVRAFERAGWVVRREGSHIILAQQGNFAVLSVPNHAELAPGLLRKLIRLSGLSVDEFIELLRV